MARIEKTVEIAAPAELVFAFFVPQRMPYWYGAEMEACFEVQGGAAEFAMAQKVRVAGRLRGREVGHTAVVTELQCARVFEWRFEDRYGVKGRERWELDRQDEAPAPRTSVRMLSDYAFPGVFGKATDWLITRHAVARRNRDYLLRLKRLAEHGEPE